MRKVTSLVASVAALVLVGAGCGNTALRGAQQAMPLVNQPLAQVLAPSGAPVTGTPPVLTIGLDEPTTLVMYQSAILADRTTITLVKIDDSRCKKDVKCIWEGELAPTLLVTAPSLPKEGARVVLGSVRTRDAVLAGTRYTLVRASTDSIVLSVHRPAD